ncbi:MAG: PorV/PorQ family protein, partial [Candidatus Marinimicrobia bacterium]|nr:PorV/PorQ family protein [Candidatus Neomarinimicrobiota bacterium]
MNKRLVLIILLLISSFGLAEEKLGQTGFQFLSVSPDARAAGMGGAMTTADWGSGALFFNPAGMANMDKRFDFAVSRNRWIADINHDAFSIAIKPPFASIGVFGISVQAVDYGTIEGTMVWANEIGYIETGLQEPTALAVGFGYARAISDRFSVGGQIKVASQYLGNNTLPAGDELVSTKNLAAATAYDFGTIFRTGFRSLTFGMSIRNFSN